MSEQAQQTQVTKTYTQRFSEMEQQIGLMAQRYLEMLHAFNTMSSIVQDQMAQIRLLNDQLQSVYDLTGEGYREKVADRVNQRRYDQIVEGLANDEKNGIIKKIDAVVSETNIVVYTAPDTTLAFKAVTNFKQEGLDSKLMGAKKGDVVGEINVVDVYEIVQQQPSQQIETA